MTDSLSINECHCTEVMETTICIIKIITAFANKSVSSQYDQILNTTDPGPESQDELSPLTVAHQLWDQLRHHGNKLFQHPVVIYKSLLHNLPHCS